MAAPSFKEDHISQLPALKLLMNMGWKYLSPEQALEARGGRTSNVLLETILKEQLHSINSIEYKGKEFTFSEVNVNNAIYPYVTFLFKMVLSLLTKRFTNSPRLAGALSNRFWVIKRVSLSNTLIGNILRRTHTTYQKNLVS